MLDNNLLVDIVLVVVIVALSLDKIIRNILLVRPPRPRWGKFTWLGPPKRRGFWYRKPPTMNEMIGELPRARPPPRSGMPQCESPCDGPPGVCPDFACVASERCIKRGAVASLRSGMWEGQPDQLILWVREGQIALSQVHPSVRSQVEYLFVHGRV